MIHRNFFSQIAKFCFRNKYVLLFFCDLLSSMIYNSYWRKETADSTVKVMQFVYKITASHVDTEQFMENKREFDQENNILEFYIDKLKSNCFLFIFLFLYDRSNFFAFRVLTYFYFTREIVMNFTLYEHQFCKCDCEGIFSFTF